MFLDRACFHDLFTCAEKSVLSENVAPSGDFYPRIITDGVITVILLGPNQPFVFSYFALDLISYLEETNY